MAQGGEKAELEGKDEQHVLVLFHYLTACFVCHIGNDFSLV
jgi:hypothetical protein